MSNVPLQRISDWLQDVIGKISIAMRFTVFTPERYGFYGLLVRKPYPDLVGLEREIDVCQRKDIVAPARIEISPS